jgi:hypothetical protein
MSTYAESLKKSQQRKYLRNGHVLAGKNIPSKCG